MKFKIEKDYLIDLLQRLVQTKSINPFGDKNKVKENNEIKISQLVEKELKKANIPCKREEVEPYRPVVIAEIGKGKGKTLLLNTHLDTVGVEGMIIPPFSGEIKNGRI